MKKYLIIITVAALLLSGCKANVSTYTELLSSEIETLDPAYAGSKSTFQLLADTFVSPTRVDDNNQLVNYGATDIEVSDDQLVYTISLRDDIVWVDDTGTEMGPVTANDYVFGYQRMVNPEVASIYSYIFENIENAKEIGSGDDNVSNLGVTALDDYTLQIKLESPIPYFTNLLAFQSYVAQPEGAFELYGDNYGTSSDTIWYDGPYYVSDFDPDYVTTLNKNDLYFDQESVTVETIEYRLNTDDTSRLNAVLNDEADFAEIDTVENYKVVKDDSNTKVQSTMYTYYLVLNNDQSAITGDSTLRHALEVGFDRETIVDSLYEGMNTPIEYIIPSNLTPSTYDQLEYRDIAGNSLTTYNKQEAEKSFDQYMADNNLTDRSQIELTFLVNGDSNDSDFAEVVQAFYKKQFGITINIEATSGGDYRERRISGGFDILLTGWAPDYGDPSTYLALWQSSNIGSQNYALYYNPDYDQLYEEANSLVDPNERLEAFAKCEQKLIDDGVLIPVYQKNQPYLINPEYQFPEYVVFLLSHQYLTSNQ